MAQERIYENEVEEIRTSNIEGMEDILFNESVQEVVLFKSESIPSLYDQYGPQDFDNLPSKSMCSEVKKAANPMDEKEEIKPRVSFRLSHFVIVDSVLRETKINPHIEALLPFPLNSIYQKFINSKQYVESVRKKDEFYHGVGLLGIGIEKTIYNQRKILDESFERVYRHCSNPKPKRLHDGTTISRVKKNRKKLNLFTIGKDLFKKNHRPNARKSNKKKSIIRRAAAQKLELAKKALNEAYASSDEIAENCSRSIALSRTKRQRKLPQLDFKYCYNDDLGIRARKPANLGKEEQYMEITDSDSSSVVEVFPTGDKENSELTVDCVSHRRLPNHNLIASKYVIDTRKKWRPKDNRALNLLDKLRLGLQCTVVQTEHDVIIQNLTLEDLSTLRSRLQGLATFKNIEAEYDKNGLETARVTIDRRVLNIPFKGFDPHVESGLTSIRKSDGSPKRKLVVSSMATDKKMPPAKQFDHSCAKIEDYCSRWARPKVRSVKKIRKLYTQSGSTPNILARPQSSIRSDPLSRTPDKQSLGMPQCHALFPSSMAEVMNNTQAGTITPVSFYPQITSMSGNIITESKDSKIMKLDSFQPNSSPDSIFVPETSTSSVFITTRNINTITTQTCSDNVNMVIASSTSLLPGYTSTPATAKSASQLLRLRKGVTQNTTESSSPSISTISMNGNDLLFANQILKPFKKNIAASSPSQLEIDEEEADFELTSSIIAQANPSEMSAKLGTSPANVQLQAQFLSSPLLKPSDACFLSGRGVTGVVVNSRRAVQLGPSPLFQSLHPLTHPSALEQGTLNAILSAYNAGECGATSTVSSTAPLSMGTNPRVRHRKWTHNFLSSNSINFREVLCSVTHKSVRPVPIAPAPPRPSGASLTQSTVTAPKVAGLDARPPSCHRAPSVAAKSSSVVLKSLLVGSTPSNELCGANKTALWSSKFMATTLSDSKIKWQLGGSVVACQAPKEVGSSDHK